MGALAAEECFKPMKYVFKDLVDRAKRQDTDAMEEIIVSLRPLILSSMGKYAAICKDKENLFQEGCLKVLEFVRDFDEGKGVPFLGYVKVNLKFFYMNYSKKYNVFVDSLDRTIECEGNNISLLDSLEDSKPLPLDIYIIKEGNKELLSAIRKLTLKQQKVIFLYYFKRMTLKDIALVLGVHYMSVVKLKQRAIANLRELLKD